MEYEVRVGEVERPLGLPLVQLLGHYKVLQVLVICPDLTLVFHTFNEVLPLLENSDNRQQLFVVDLIVQLNGREELGEESDWVPVFIFQRHLGEDSTSYKVETVDFNAEELG